jgi:hypothetical protein
MARTDREVHPGVRGLGDADPATGRLAGALHSSISPDNGPAAGGTTVTIAGRNFSGATAVMFGSNAATSFVVDSDSQITAVSPPAS